jgi:Tfp pilus assembly protein PilF
MRLLPATRIACFSLLLVLLGGCARSPEAKAQRARQRGLEWMQKKDYRHAVIEFLNAAQLQPRDSDAQYQLGKAYLYLGDRPNAAKSFRKAVNDGPKNWAAKVALASMLAHSRDEINAQEAQDLATQVPAGTPQTADAADLLSYLDWRAGRKEAAEQRLQQTVNASPSHTESTIELADMMMRDKRYEDAGRLLADTAAKTPEVADSHFALAQFYIIRGNTDGAVAELERTMQINPQHSPALARLAGLYERLGHAAKAEAAYKKLSAGSDKQFRSLYGQYLFRTGKKDAATAEFLRLAKSDPQDRIAREQLVSVYEATGQSARAEESINATLKKNPKDIEALLRRAEFLISHGRYADAEKDLNYILNLRADSAQVHYAVSRLFAAQNQRLRQRSELTRALELDPRLLGARTDLIRLLVALHDGAGAAKLAGETPEDQKNNRDSVAAHNWVLLAQQNFGALREGVQTAQKLGDTPELRYLDAVGRFHDKDYAGARAAVESVITAMPHSLDVWQLLAGTSAAMKDPGYAVLKLEAYTALHPGYIDLLLLLGQWKLGAGDTTGSRQAYEAVLKVNPSDFDGALRLAELDDMAGNTGAATLRAEQILAAHPDSVRGRIVLATLYKKAGKRSEAADLYRKTIDIAPGNIAALNDLACLLAPSKPYDALNYAQQALKIAPENATVLDTMGWVEYHLGHYTDAVHHLEAASKKDSGAVFSYHLALAYSKAGNKELGDKAMKAAMTKDPTLSFGEDEALSLPRR